MSKTMAPRVAHHATPVIRDALRGVGVSIGRTTVANYLAEPGMIPAPERTRTRTWKQFLKIHLDTLYACDFFSVEALGINGTVRHMVFFVIEIKSRAVEIAGISVYPNETWMKQVARNSTDPIDGFLRNATHLIHDRDPLFTDEWTKTWGTSGVKCVPIPANSPNCNAYAERFVKTIRNECLDHMVLFGERHVRHVVREYVAHYMGERCHQGVGSAIICPDARAANDNGPLTEIRCRSRLGGLLNYYHREAA